MKILKAGKMFGVNCTKSSEANIKAFECKNDDFASQHKISICTC